MTIFKKRGGAQVGWVSASWPAAGIEVGASRLAISSLGTYVFAPNEVTAVESVGAIPFLTQGIRVHHTKAEYPERVVFYTLSGREALLAAVRAAGLSVGQAVAQAKRGFPMRLPAVVLVIVLWNLLFFLDKPNLKLEHHTPGPYVLIALAMLFTLALLLPRSAWLQALFMREGRDIGEVASLLRLMQIVSGLMLLGFGISYLSQCRPTPPSRGQFSAGFARLQLPLVSNVE